MGAVAVTQVRRAQDTSRKRVDALVTFSSSYATGGDTVKPGDLGLIRITDILVFGSKGSASHGLQVVLAGTDAAPKLKLVAGALGSAAEVTNATNTSSRSAKVRFIGY